MVAGDARWCLMAELRDRDKIEAQFARRLARLGGRHRNELMELMGNPPDPSRVPDSFWERVRREEEAELLAMLLLIFIASATQHGADRQKAEAQAQVWAFAKASNQSAQRASNRRQSFAKLAREIEDRSRGDVPLKPVDVRQRVSVVVGASPAEAERVAVSNTTDAGASGGEFGVKDQGLESPKDKWRTERDARVCPICQPLNGTTRSNWEAKFPEGPPAHERCRCEIVYANQPVLNRQGELVPAIA